MKNISDLSIEDLSDMTEDDLANYLDNYPECLWPADASKISVVILKLIKEIAELKKQIGVK